MFTVITPDDYLINPGEKSINLDANIGGCSSKASNDHQDFFWYHLIKKTFNNCLIIVIQKTNVKVTHYVNLNTWIKVRNRRFERNIKNVSSYIYTSRLWINPNTMIPIVVVNSGNILYIPHVFWMCCCVTTVCLGSIVTGILFFTYRESSPLFNWWQLVNKLYHAPLYSCSVYELNCALQRPKAAVRKWFVSSVCSVWKYFFSLLYLFKTGAANARPRPRESDLHHISPKTPAPQYQIIKRKKWKGKG